MCVRLCVDICINVLIHPYMPLFCMHTLIHICDTYIYYLCICIRLYTASHSHLQPPFRLQSSRTLCAAHELKFRVLNALKRLRVGLGGVGGEGSVVRLTAMGFREGEKS